MADIETIRAMNDNTILLIIYFDKQYTNKQFAEIRLVHKY
jgi:hypothetical protein